MTLQNFNITHQTLLWTQFFE